MNASNTQATQSLYYCTWAGTDGGGRCGQPLPWLASDAHPNSHECAKGAATLHHGFPDAAHQLPTPHSDPETGKGAEERPGRHAHGATHHKAHLHAVEAARLGLSIGTHGHRHLARGLDRSALRLTQNARRSAFVARGIASGALSNTSGSQ